MISKERLQELIDKKATIWADDYGEIQLCDESKICYDEFLETVIYYLSGFMHGGKFVNDGIMPNFLEEDIEKGEWQHEMHASRLERFEPPLWEEINENTDWRFCFFTRDGRDYWFTVNGFIECIDLDSEYSESYYFDFTKEDYIKACTIARKLFLGESVDEI